MIKIGKPDSPVVREISPYDYSVKIEIVVQEGRSAPGAANGTVGHPVANRYRSAALNSHITVYGDRTSCSAAIVIDPESAASDMEVTVEGKVVQLGGNSP